MTYWKLRQKDSGRFPHQRQNPPRYLEMPSPLLLSSTIGNASAGSGPNHSRAQ